MQMQKLLTFFKNFSIYAIFNDQCFNDTLTNGIVSFEQLGPYIFLISPHCIVGTHMYIYCGYSYTCIVGTHVSWVLVRSTSMRTHYICFCGEIRKIFIWMFLLSRAMAVAQHQFVLVTFICICFLFLMDSPGRWTFHTFLILHFTTKIITIIDIVTFTTLWANSAIDKLMIFLFSFQKTGFDISCKLSPMETICMKCQILFSVKIKKNISKCCLLKILPRVLSDNDREHL